MQRMQWKQSVMQKKFSDEKNRVIKIYDTGIFYLFSKYSFANSAIMGEIDFIVSPEVFTQR